MAPRSGERERLDARFEDYPLTRQEYISVMIHFYRGEIQRSTVWRQRLDATTNWAVLTTAAMLSFSLRRRPEQSHDHPAAVQPDHPLLPAHRGAPLPLLRGLPGPGADARGELPDPGR